MIDVLTNSMEIIAKDEFLEMFMRELSEESLSNIWDEYWKLSASDRFSYGDEEWYNFIILHIV